MTLTLVASGTRPWSSAWRRSGMLGNMVVPPDMTTLLRRSLRTSPLLNKCQICRILRCGFSVGSYIVTKQFPQPIYLRSQIGRSLIHVSHKVDNMLEFRYIEAEQTQSFVDLDCQNIE